MNPINSVYRLAGFLILTVVIIGFGFLFWDVIGNHLAEKLNRTGMLLELLGILSVIPEIVGEAKIKAVEEKFVSLSVQFKTLLKSVNRLISEGIFTIASELFMFPNGVINQLILIANTFGSILLVLDLFYLKTPASTEDINAKIFFYIFDISALLWLISGITIFVISRLSKREKPTILLKVFFVIFILPHIMITVFSLPFTIALAILLKLTLNTSLFFFRFSLRQVIAWVTIPLILLGNLFQFLSTYT